MPLSYTTVGERIRVLPGASRKAGFLVGAAQDGHLRIIIDTSRKCQGYSHGCGCKHCKKRADGKLVEPTSQPWESRPPRRAA
jgi:hypothetical protein